MNFNVVWWALGGYLVYRVFAEEPTHLGIIPVELTGQLSQEQQEALEARVRAGDTAAFKRLATTNMQAIRDIVGRMERVHGERLDDLMLPAVEGYRKAILAGDARAVGFIRNAVLDYKEKEQARGRGIVSRSSNVFLDAEPEEGEGPFELPSTMGTPEELSEAKLEVLRRLAFGPQTPAAQQAVRQGRDEFIKAMMRRGLESTAITSELARMGLPLSQLAVRKAMVRLGAKPKPVSTAKSNEARRLIRAGVRDMEVAAQTGLSYNRILRIRKAMGVRYRQGERGSKHWGAKVDEAKVQAIRVAYAAGEPVRDLMSKYGLTQTTVNDIVARRTWRHV